MAWFEYEGLTAGGTAIAGRLEAADREQAAEDLAGMQIDVRDLRSAEPPPRRSAPLSADDLAHYQGERGRRGNKLPRGLQRVDQVDIEI